MRTHSHDPHLHDQEPLWAHFAKPLAILVCLLAAVVIVNIH